ncbi:hypothetical protein L1987_48768 [Smallanthus sonchifolius]|uniref:Uncharacterized protein n=1 Tax=Smallanthus sonchifolius TaxID=185202 RepID=A0ACB9FTY9_9ASTR|nr:hypothetical protein L1987_48768 [Smallanthus sonchifolius]
MDGDLSSVHDHGSGDAMINQAIVDNSTTISTDQMPIVDPSTPDIEDVSDSHEAEVFPDHRLSNLSVHAEFIRALTPGFSAV